MDEREWQTNCKDIQNGTSMGTSLLMETRNSSDCTILVGPAASSFKAHKLMLANASPVFEAIFMEGSAEQDTFAIPDVKPEPVNYITTKKIDITSFKWAQEMYTIANKYLLHQLARVCSEYMISNVTLETAFEAYEAGTKCQDQALIYESQQVIKMNISELLHSKSFEDVDIELVAEIFSIEDLKVDEMDLYQYLERRVQAQSSRKRCSSPVREESEIEALARRSVRKALKHIRFLTFSLEDFAQGPARSGFFTKAEALAILLNIAKADGVPMPPGFSTNTQARFQRPVTPVANSAVPVTSGVLRVTMSNLKISSVSAPCMMLKKPWVLKVIPYNVYSHNNGPRHYSHLSVFLKCESTDSTPWACTAHVEFKLLAAKCGKQDLVVPMERTFTNLDTEFGVDQFIRDADATNENNGYLRDGKITFAANVILEHIDWNRSSKASTSSGK